VEDAAKIAVETVIENMHDKEHLRKVIFACFGEATEQALKQALARHQI
jgi:O-acetyl-ADP-ribose deacetylase (regulator of RNase III)